MLISSEAIAGQRLAGGPGHENSFWTFDSVEQRLVDAVILWRRSPGGGRWPFASDGPWHLLTRDARAGSLMESWRQEIDAVAREAEAAAARSPLPLTRAEVCERDQASAWLEMVPEGDRKIVVLALLDLAGGRRVAWRAMLPKLGLNLGAHGLARRYRKAIGGVAAALNARRVAVTA